MNTGTLPKPLLAAAKSADWRAMPRAISEFRASGGKASGTQFWEAAAFACGCPAHALRQRCSAYELVVSNGQELGQEGVESAWSRSYTQLELIGRIDQLDHEAAMRLLANPLLDNSVARLRGRLEEVRAKTGEMSGLIQGHQALNAAKTLVARHLETRRLAQDYQDQQTVRFRAWAGGGQYISPSMIAARVRGGSVFCEAILVSAKRDRESVYKVLAKAAFESTFVDRYWIALSRSVEAVGLEKRIHVLGLHNVGSLAFDAERGEVSIFKPPGGNPPLPDRRHLLALPSYYFI